MIGSRGKGNAGGMRLGPQPSEVIERNRPISFKWNGTAYSGFTGDTITSALAASGVRVFSRSFKYHRPRGLLTASFHDPGCIVQIGDEPNVRASHRELAAGMDVRAQNAWPSLRFDLAATNQAIGRFLGPGFYYKTFMRPRALWPAYERVLQQFAPGGRVSPATERGKYDKRYAHPDVLVAGGGPAGMAAALSAADAGASVILVDEEYELGGHLRYGGPAELDLMRELTRAVHSRASIEVLVNSAVTGRYDDNWVAVLQRGLPHVTERLVKARAKVLVVAPGLLERPYVFEGNDLPGVMLSTAARRLINLYAVKPGKRAVVFTANDEGLAAAADLDRVGVRLLAVVDARAGGELVRAKGAGELNSVEFAGGLRYECDLLVTAVGWTAPTLLVNMSGDRPHYHEISARFVPGGNLPPNVLATGGLVGDGPLPTIVEHGRAVGAVAAARAGDVSDWRRPPASRYDPPDPVGLEPAPHPSLFQARTHGVVDYSEDVSSKDLVSAVKEGYDSVELLKRYTTATMGPTQGKLETVNTVAVLAQATGRSMGETGTTVWRPPHVPISLGALAGRILEPTRYSPIQPWHELHGATPIIAGQWIRPEHYGSAESEVRNVRENVGLIDVTPLGKLDMRGPDVPKLLSFLYVNKWSKLEVGAARYGVMCAEDGVVLDDGVTGHLGPDHYFTSTTSSGATAVHEWIESWLQTAFAALAGPGNFDDERLCEHQHRRSEVTRAPAPSSGRDRPVARGLCLHAGEDRADRWCSELPDVADRIHGRAQLRDTRACRLRVVRVGATHGRWGGSGSRSLRSRGPADHAAREGAFHRRSGYRCPHSGLLRRSGLAREARQGRLCRQAGARLGGRPRTRAAARWPAADGPQLVPPEASQIISGRGTIEGRITSSRFSPTLDRAVCLGFVSAQLAAPGTEVTVRLPDGRRVLARVTAQPAHFDPEGSRLRG